MDNNRFLCPVCDSCKLMMKYEAKYVYSYAIDNDAPGLKNKAELLPYLYDKREQTEARQFIECSSCGTQFPCFSQDCREFDFKLLHGAIYPGNADRPELLNRCN